MNTNQKVNITNQILINMYGPQGWWPTTLTPGQPPVYYPGREGRIVTDKACFEIIVGAILTQNTSWTGAEKAIVNLTTKRLMDSATLAASDEHLETAITPARYFNQKAKYLRGIAHSILTAGGIAALRPYSTPKLRKLLLAWNGVGPETADSILCYAFNRPIFVVDAYTRRLFKAVHLPSESYDVIQTLVHASLRPSAAGFGDFHARIVKLMANKELEKFMRLYDSLGVKMFSQGTLF